MCVHVQFAVGAANRILEMVTIATPEEKRLLPASTEHARLVFKTCLEGEKHSLEGDIDMRFFLCVAEYFPFVVIVLVRRKRI